MDNVSDNQEWELEMEMESIETKIDLLIEHYNKLLEENRTLKRKQEELVRERAQLMEKTATAKTRVEAMITRLKSIGHSV